MNAKSRQYKRRNYFIDKKFQTKFILKFCSLLALGSAFIVAIIFWWAGSSTTVGISEGRIAVHTTAEYLLPLLVQTFFIELVIISIAAIALTMLVSHSIAGPVHRFMIMLKGLGEGDLSSPMQLREGDQLQQVSIVYNEALEKIQTKIKLAKNSQSLDEIKKILNTFKT